MKSRKNSMMCFLSFLFSNCNNKEIAVIDREKSRDSNIYCAPHSKRYWNPNDLIPVSTATE